MIIKVKITKCEKKPFKNSDGDQQEYFWYKAERQDDGVTINFGSGDGTHEVGQILDVDLEKRENESKPGKFRYIEPSH